MILTLSVPSCLVTPNKNRKREIVIPCVTKKGIHQEIQDLGRYSSRCRYTKQQYYYTVNSVARILNKERTLIYVDWNHKSYKRILPKGWKWKKDQHGLKLQQTGTDIDYHPSVSEIRSLSVQYLISLARKNYLARQFQDYDLAIKRLTSYNLTMSDIYVVREDSYKAGNCKVGTEEFVRQNGWEKYVSADKIPLNHRSKLAICQAIRRNIQDLDNGYCAIN